MISGRVTDQGRALFVKLITDACSRACLRHCSKVCIRL